MLNNSSVVWSVIALVVILLLLAIYAYVRISMLSIATTKKEVQKLIDTGMTEQEARARMKKRYSVRSPLTLSKFIIISILILIYILLVLSGLI